MLLLVSFLAAGLMAQKRPPAPPKPDPFLTSPVPFTLEFIVTYVKNIRAGVIPNDKRLIEAIRNRRVDFPLTPATESLLKNSGASEQLLELIRKVAPPPPPDPTGSLTVKCAPAECEVLIKGAPAGSTAGGEMTTKSLPVGPTLVDLKKAGYIGVQRTVVIEANKTALLESGLEPDANTKAEFGKQLLTAMLQHIGDKSAIPASFYGTGSATARLGAGKSGEWEFTETFAPGPSVVFDLHALKINLELRCAGENCAFKTGKSKNADLEDIGATLRILLKYQFPAMLGRIQSDKLAPSAPSVDLNSTAEQHFRLEGEDESFDVVVGPDLLPVRISSMTKGAPNPTVVSYAHFVKLGELQYPLETELKLPDAEQHGIAVKLAQVAPGSKQKEKRLLKFPR